MLSQQAEKLLADAAGWLPDWSWLFPSEIYVAIVSWFFQTIFVPLGIHWVRRAPILESIKWTLGTLGPL